MIRSIALMAAVFSLAACSRGGDEGRKARTGVERAANEIEDIRSRQDSRQRKGEEQVDEYANRLVKAQPRHEEKADEIVARAPENVAAANETVRELRGSIDAQTRDTQNDWARSYISGTVASTDGSTVRVTDDTGAVIEVKTDPSTRVLDGEQPIAASAVKPGQEVTVGYQVKDGTNVATEIGIGGSGGEGQGKPISPPSP